MTKNTTPRGVDPDSSVTQALQARRGFPSQADIREDRRAPQRLDNTGNENQDLIGPLNIKGDVTINEGLLKIEIVNDDVDGLQVGPIIDPAFPSGPALYFKQTSGKCYFVITDVGAFPMFRVLPNDNLVQLQYGAKLEFYDDAGNTLAGTISSTITNVDVTGNWNFVGSIVNTGAVTIARDGTLTFQVEKADLTKVFVVDTTNKIVKLWNGTDLIVYTDAGTTIVFSVDGATGAITQDGQATPATPAAGFATIYPNTSGLYEAVDPNGDVWSVGKTQTAKKGSDQAISTTTLTTVTGLSFTLQANRVYFFEYFLVHQSGTSTTGLKLAINVATATITEITYQTEIQVLNTANGTANVEVQNHVANNSTHTAANQIANATSSIAKVTGSIVVGGTGGTLNLQFAGDAAASITAKQGSYGRLSF